MTRVTSSGRLSLPKVTRNAPCARSAGIPMATKTWLGSIDADVQADPLDAAMPCMSRVMRSGSLSMPEKQKEQ